MIHNFFLAGTLKKINVSTPKDPSRPASAILLIQYGDTRESTGGSVEFVNAVMVRIPSYSYPRLADKLVEGKEVTIHGHLQGVFKSVMDEGHFTAELVADRVYTGDKSTGPRAPQRNVQKAAPAATVVAPAAEHAAD